MKHPVELCLKRGDTLLRHFLIDRELHGQSKNVTTAISGAGKCLFNSLVFGGQNMPSAVCDILYKYSETNWKHIVLKAFKSFLRNENRTVLDRANAICRTQCRSQNHKIRENLRKYRKIPPKMGVHTTWVDPFDQLLLFQTKPNLAVL